MHPAYHCCWTGQEQVSAYCQGGFKYIKCDNEGTIQPDGRCCSWTVDTGSPIDICTDGIHFYPLGDGYTGPCTLVVTARFVGYDPTWPCGFDPSYCVGPGQSYKDAWCVDGNKYVECWTEGTFTATTDGCCSEPGVCDGYMVDL